MNPLGPIVHGLYFSSDNVFSIRPQLVPVVQKVDNAIHQINLYPLDSAIRFPNTYPLDNGLSCGYSAIHLLNNRDQVYTRPWLFKGWIALSTG